MVAPLTQLAYETPPPARQWRNADLWEFALHLGISIVLLSIVALLLLALVTLVVHSQWLATIFFGSGLFGLACAFALFARSSFIDAMAIWKANSPRPRRFDVADEAFAVIDDSKK